MSLAINRESFFWHKVHSLTGIVPVGYYMVQHLALNSFSLGGAKKFDAVIEFFEGIPIHLLLLLEIGMIWVPLLFHAVYGLFIVSRGQPNYISSKYKWSQNRMYSFQRYTGIVLFFFLIYHVLSTTGAKYVTHNVELIKYAHWHQHLTEMGGLFLIIYGIGVLCASYHLAFGIWNFCIRWGITISDRAQLRIQKFSTLCFIVITLLGWAALGGFLLNRTDDPAPVTSVGDEIKQIPTSTFN